MTNHKSFLPFCLTEILPSFALQRNEKIWNGSCQPWVATILHQPWTNPGIPNRFIVTEKGKCIITLIPLVDISCLTMYIRTYNSDYFLMMTKTIAAVTKMRLKLLMIVVYLVRVIMMLKQ